MNYALCGLVMAYLLGAFMLFFEVTEFLLGDPDDEAAGENFLIAVFFATVWPLYIIVTTLGRLVRSSRRHRR